MTSASEAGRRAAETPAPDRGGRLLRTAVLAYAPLALAALLTGVAALLDGTTFSEVVLLPPGAIPLARLLVGLLAWLAGAAGTYFVPGLLLLRTLEIRPSNAPAAAFAAFVLSLVAVSVGWIVARGALAGPVGRMCFYLTVAIVDLAILLAGLCTAPRAPALPRFPGAPAGRARVELLVPVVGLLLLLGAVAVTMPGKITTEALEGDATEVYGFAASLELGPLPKWDLEAGVWGFYPTFMFIAYPVFFSLMIDGGIEAAVRLPALLAAGLMLLAAADLTARGRTRFAAGSLSVLIPFLALGYLTLQAGAYYAGYHPFHGDLGCSPLEEWLVTALALAAVVLLRDGLPGVAAIAGFFSLITFASGLAVVGLFAVAGVVFTAPAARRPLVRAGLAFGLIVAGWSVFVVIHGVATGTLGPVLGEWWSKYFQGRGEVAGESGMRMLRALGWWALLAGGLPVVGLPLALAKGDRTARWMAAVGVAWVVVFTLSPNKNIHYFFPAALLPLGAALRSTAGPGGDRGGMTALVVATLLTISTAVAVALSRPVAALPYVADREFGRRTFFVASSEREAVEYSRVLFNLTTPLSRWKPGRPWTIGRHTWVMYADRGVEPEREYDFYVGRIPPAGVEGLLEVTRVGLAGGGVATLWSPGGRAAFREWKSRTFPLRRDQSRFNFEM